MIYKIYKTNLVNYSYVSQFIRRTNTLRLYHEVR
jgi:hypothetical protein